ncbi:MAG TPA: hypothetical protein VE077_09855 [Candidatus Methylomirabilis sp.]|nr:hypothetical protein [Candidatus Methylomirabilis sp.]
MAWLSQKLRLPASESTMGVVLTFCVITMALLSIALLWQAEIIANQREVIRWLEAARLGS